VRSACLACFNSTQGTLLVSSVLLLVLLQLANVQQASERGQESTTYRRQTLRFALGSRAVSRACADVAAAGDAPSCVLQHRVEEEQRAAGSAFLLSWR